MTTTYQKSPDKGQGWPWPGPEPDLVDRAKLIPGQGQLSVDRTSRARARASENS